MEGFVMTEKTEEYMLALLEELRYTTASLLLVTSRLRDDLKGYTDTDERTYKTAEAEVSDSVDRLTKVYEKLGEAKS